MNNTDALRHEYLAVSEIQKYLNISQSKAHKLSHCMDPPASGRRRIVPVGEADALDLALLRDAPPRRSMLVQKTRMRQARIA